MIQKKQTIEADITLRFVHPSDEAFLEAVYTETRRGELAPFGWSEEQQAAFCQMQFRLQTRAYRMQFPAADYYIVEYDATPIGRMIVERGEKEIRLVDISLLAEFRNRGIGTILLERLKDEARNEWILSLCVLKTNAAAKRLYERLGLEVVEDAELHFTMQWRNS